jgi:hypothetical protein
MFYALSDVMEWRGDGGGTMYAVMWVCVVWDGVIMWYENIYSCMNTYNKDWGSVRCTSHQAQN